MRLLIATETYHPNINGASVFTRRIAQGLASRGHEVHVIAPSTDFSSFIEEDGGVFVHRIRSVPTLVDPHYRFSPLAEFEVGQIVGRVAPHVVHIQDHFFISGAAMKSARGLGIPVLGTNHFVPEGLLHYLPLPAEGQKLARHVAWKSCIDLYNRLNFVTSPSEAAVNLLRQRGLLSPAVAVSNGIDTMRFHPRRDGASLREKLGLPSKPTILYTGRLETEKRMDIWISAIPHVLKHIDAHFAICGSGTEKPKLQRLVETLSVNKAVTFIPFLDDDEFPAVYATAHVFAIAGAVELQSIVTLEAMASGLPVVAARALALPELVRDDDNGYLFGDGDSREMADNVVRILSSQRIARRMGRRSRQIAEGHSIDKTLMKYEGIYLSLRNGEHPHPPSRQLLPS